MKWRGYRRSSNVQYRSGGRGRGMALGGGLGIGGLVIVGLNLDVHGARLPYRPDGRRDGHGRRRQRRRRGARRCRARRPTTRRPSSRRSPRRPRDTWSVVFQEQVGRAYEPPNVVVFENATQVRMRRCAGRDGTALLPHRQHDLHGPRLLREALLALRRAGATSRSPMSSRTRLGTTSRTNSASCRKSSGSNAPTRWRRTSSRCASS